MEENKSNETEQQNDKEKLLQNQRNSKNKRRPSILISIILVIFGALIGSGIFFLCFKDKILTSNLDNVKFEEMVEPEQNNEENNNVQEQVKVPEIDLNINGDFIKSLYKKVPVNYLVQAIYDDNLTAQVDLTQKEKMLFVLDNMRENKEYEEMDFEDVFEKSSMTYDISKVQKYTIADVEKNYKSVFGSDREIDKFNYLTVGYIYGYDEQDDCFYGYTYPGGGGNSFVYRTVLDSAEKNNDGTEIYLYDYYIKAKENYTENSNRKYEIYTYSTSGSSIGTEEDRPYSYDYYIYDNVFNKYKGNGLVKFKHTFKLDDTGNYYWYSCMPVIESNY